MQVPHTVLTEETSDICVHQIWHGMTRKILLWNVMKWQSTKLDSKHSAATLKYNDTHSNIEMLTLGVVII